MRIELKKSVDKLELVKIIVPIVLTCTACQPDYTKKPEMINYKIVLIRKESIIVEGKARNKTTVIKEYPHENRGYNRCYSDANQRNSKSQDYKSIFFCERQIY